MDEEALRRDLLRWYAREARDLPWRRSKDPYAVWVSEIMLQQTRVDVATPYFERWMARFPTVAALAAADVQDVLRAWAGLGYYSRARNLHAAARVLAERGRLPDTSADWHDLPGIGAYTAGAIASIALGERVPAVDGNVVRVLARLHAWTGSASAPALRAKVDAAAARLVPADEPGDWNQAVMDLGATVCTPRNPRCGDCPVAAHCKAGARGLQETIPAPKRKAAARLERRAFAVVRDAAGRVLLVRNPARGLLAGLWSLPGTADAGDAGDGAPLAAAVRAQAGVRVRLHGPAATARHQFSHRTWEMSVRRARLTDEATSGTSGNAPGTLESTWVPEDELEHEAVPTAIRAALQAVGVGKPKSRKGSRTP